MSELTANLATLVALVGEAVNNDHAEREASIRAGREARRRREQSLRRRNRSLRACLTRAKRLEFEAWRDRCRRLGVHVGAQEKHDVLLELINRRAA
jgi:hypothetical protein